MPDRTPASTNRPPTRSGLLFLHIGAYGTFLLGLSAIGLVWAGALYFIHAERLQTEQSALHNAGNLARAFEEQIIRSIRAANQTLLYVRDSYARDPQQFDISVWRNSEFLAGFNFQIALIGKDGLMIASNIPGAKPGLDLSDREHFKVHTQRQSDELFISEPLFGRVSQKWSIQVTRRINMSDGSFGGVVVVSLDPDYLSQFYNSIDTGEHGVATLVGKDGIVRARGSRGPSAVGASLAQGKLFEAVRQAPAGTYASRSPIDQVDRLFAYREVRDLPLIVTVGLAKQEVFATIERNQRSYLLVAAILTVWLLGATFLMWRYQQSLAEARDAAEAGTRARSEFLAMMSHEIRTPMNGVVGMSELLIESGLKPDQLSYARTLHESAGYLLRIINDVLDLSKLEADRIEIEQIEFDLHDVVEGCVAVLATNAKEKNLALSAVIAPDVPAWVIGDSARLRQVLFNLVGNAVKFTKAGSVTIKVGIDPQPALPKHIRLAFAVSDTGIGIPADGIPLLFREFSQVDSSISRRFGGTGLGLAICKRLVRLMGGSISVASEIGKGTTFSFTVDFRPGSSIGVSTALLPVSATPAAQTRGAQPKQRAPRILVVEDNKTNRIVATKLLFSLGYRANFACNGIEAVAACAATAYDLVFMDVMMPEMDGLSATREIRKLMPPFCEPRIIALTANAMMEDRNMCLAAGMDDYLSKPVTRAGLQAKVERLVSFPNTAIRQISAEQDTGDAAIFERSIYAQLTEALGADDAAMLVGTFLADTAQRVGEMRRAGKDGDKETVKREAHALKSSAASLGFMRLAALAKALECDALGLGWPNLNAAIGILTRAFEEIQDIAQSRCRADSLPA